MQGGPPPPSAGRHRARHRANQQQRLVVISFKGLESVVDALEGVDVTVDHSTYDTETHKRFAKGVNHINGEQALFYVRQRHGLDGGDFDRIKRQHQFLAALLSRPAPPAR